MTQALPIDAVAIRTTILVREDGNGFFGSCEEFPGVVIGALNEKECLKLTRAAVKDHLEVLMAEGLSIPEEAIVRNQNEIRPKQLNSIEHIPVSTLTV